MPQLSTTDSNVKWPFCFAFACYAVLQTKRLCNQSRQVQIYKQEAFHHAIHKLTLWAVSNEKWDTKKDKGKFMTHVFYVQWYAKKHISG